MALLSLCKAKLLLKGWVCISGDKMGFRKASFWYWYPGVLGAILAILVIVLLGHEFSIVEFRYEI